MEKKDVWSTSDIIANRNSWSLAADVELLKHLQSLSEKIVTQATSTLQSLNSFENDVNQTCITVANANNKFKALSDTQFIESKVQEENLEINEPSNFSNETPADFKNEQTTIKLKQALENGFQVLDTKYDVYTVSGSDTEDDEPQEPLLKPRNPYLSRRLPYIIGSEEFTRNDNLGLVDSSSSEEEEEEEDTDDEDEDEKNSIDSDDEEIAIPKPPPMKSEFIHPRTEIIRISSSDSEDSEVSVSSDRSNRKDDSSVNVNKFAEKSNETVQTPNSFADTLSAALKNNTRNIYNVIPPDFGDTFSPPPFPGKDNDSSDDSDISTDIFASKKNTKHSITHTNNKSLHYDGDTDDDEENSNSQSGKATGIISKEPSILEKPIESSRKSSIASRTSQHPDSCNNPSIGHETSKKDKSTDQLDQSKPKITESNSNALNKKMVSAISAELNQKLKIKKPTENNSSATSIESVSNDVPAKITKPNKPSIKARQSNVKKEPKNEVFHDIDNESNSEQDNEDDLFSGVLTSKKSTRAKKSKGLFDDDDNIDNLFSPVKSSAKSTTKHEDLFSTLPKEAAKSSNEKRDDDLFSSKPKETVKTEKLFDESQVKSPVVDLFKKSDLFASDSDSEDDIFSIIKGKNKSSSNASKPKTESLFDDNYNAPKSKTIRETKVTENESNLNEEFTPSALENLPEAVPALEKTSSNESVMKEKLADSAKKSIPEEVDIAAITSSTNKDSLFKEIKKKDLFESDDDDEINNDLFSKTIKSSDKQKSVLTNTMMSNTTDILKNNSTEITSGDSFDKTDNTNKEVNPKSVANEIDHNLSTESINEVEKTDQTDKKSNIFARNKSQHYSSSSEDEDIGFKNASTDLFPRSVEDESKEKETTKQSPEKDNTREQDIENLGETLSPKKDDLFGESFSDKTKSFISTPIQDLFGETAKVSKINTENNDSSKDDIFGESYSARSAMFLPPKDDLIIGSSEDEDIKDNNYLSQDDDDLFSEKFEPPPFKEAIFDDDIFGKKPEVISQESSNIFSAVETSPVEDLFAKSSKSIDSIISPDLTSKKKETEGQNDELFNHEKLSNPVAKSHLQKETSTVESETEVQKNVKKIDAVESSNILNYETPEIAHETKNDVPEEPEKTGLFKFNKNDMFRSDSDSDEFVADEILSKNVPDSNKTTVSVEESKNPVNTEKVETENTNQLNINDENVSVDDDSTKKPLNLKIGKINTNLFEKNNTPNKDSVSDEQDGNISTKSVSPETTPTVRNKPGKLAANLGLKINVNALLPGSNWSSKMKQQATERLSPTEKKQVVEPIIPSEKQSSIEKVTPEEPQNISDNSSNLLNSVTKERAKVSNRRRPPSRQARRNRISNENNFVVGFEDWLISEENNSSVSSNSLNVSLKDDSQKEKKPMNDIFTDDLFGDDESKSDDLFATSKSKASSISKESDEVINNLPSSIPSSRSESNSDFNVDNISQNRLPNLTKGRAKPQKRIIAPKKSSDHSVINTDDNLPSSVPVSNPIVEKSRVLTNENTSTTSNKPNPKTVAKSIFDSLEGNDEDLFESLKSKKTVEEKPKPKIEEKKETKPTPLPIQEPTKAKTVKEAKIDIFDDDDDDELFTSSKKKLSGSKLSKKSSLFEDNDDDDLFGTKTSTSSNKKTLDSTFTSAKTKVLNEKPRVVKLRSETVQKDPLSGKDLTSSP